MKKQTQLGRRAWDSVDWKPYFPWSLSPVNRCWPVEGMTEAIGGQLDGQNAEATTTVRTKRSGRWIGGRPIQPRRWLNLGRQAARNI
jgi:hypothetical protein